ncbi:cupin domain-containing protein [Candidatus Pacearchaeota archaeon]|nr:cupin domain-containing protein [Candidatus Pacearchaeota archaeon]
MLRIFNKTGLDEERLKVATHASSNGLNDFDFSKVIVRKPWGHEYLFYEGNNLASWILHIKKGSMTSMHCHENKTTFLIILSGKAKCSSLSESHELNEGDCMIIEKGSFHSTEAISNGGIILMEIENPVNKTDLVRLKDNYGRESKGYEKQKEMCFDLSEYERVFLSDEKTDIHKKIGNMNVYIKEFKDNESLKSYLKIYTNSINFVLTGEITDEMNSKIYKNGDVLEIKNLRDIENIKTDNKVKILNISKNVLDYD